MQYSYLPRGVGIEPTPIFSSFSDAVSKQACLASGNLIRDLPTRSHPNNFVSRYAGLFGDLRVARGTPASSVGGNAAERRTVAML